MGGSWEEAIYGEARGSKNFNRCFSFSVLVYTSLLASFVSTAAAVE